jgi:hypothetical protein
MLWQTVRKITSNMKKIDICVAERGEYFQRLL